MVRWGLKKAVTAGNQCQNYMSENTKKPISMQQATPIDVALARVFKPLSPETAMLNEEFYYKYAYKLGADCCTVVAAWGAKYEGRYSDVTHAIRTVVDAFVDIVEPWGTDLVAGLFPCPDGTLHHRTAHPQDAAGNKINGARFHACALNLNFARDLLNHDFGFLALVRKCLVDRNWTNRPQGKLLAALSAQYVEQMALLLHGSASLEVLEATSPYWSMVNHNNSVVVLRQDGGSAAEMGWIDYPLAVEHYKHTQDENIKEITVYNMSEKD